MLGSAVMVPMLGTMKPELSKAFYQDTLGLKFVSDDGFGMVFEGKNAKLRISKVPAIMPAAYSVLSFYVEDVEKTVDALLGKGVVMARYGFLPQDAKGIWTSPDGSKVAWFHDPDLNLLAVAQLA